MIKLYSAPRTRSIRVAWLLEELDVDYEIESSEFVPTPTRFFIQKTPTGKYPTIDDDGFILFESGAILEYLCEKYQNTLMPTAGSRAKAQVLQWMHFADATAFSPLGIVIWLSVYRQDADQHPQLIEDSRQRAMTGLSLLESHMEGREYLTDSFSPADIMMGFTVLAANMLGLIDETSVLQGYLQRLQARPAFQTAFKKTGGFG